MFQSFLGIAMLAGPDLRTWRNALGMLAAPTVQIEDELRFLVRSQPLSQILKFPGRCLTH